MSIRKDAISSLLEVFRPNLDCNQNVFNEKKYLVVGAIDAIYTKNKV